MEKFTTDVLINSFENLLSFQFKNYNTLKDPEVVKQLANILKTNVRSCQALGCPYISQVNTNNPLKEYIFFTRSSSSGQSCPKYYVFVSTVIL